MNIKGIVFFDLDGTLLNSDSHISTDNQLALKQLKANGYLPVIATGRSIIEISDIIQESGINSVAMLNGMVVQVDGKIVFEESISPQDISKALKIAESLGEGIAYYTPEKIIISTDSPGLKAHFHYFNGQLPKIDHDFYLHKAVNMILVGGSQKENDHLFPEAISELRFLRNSPYSIDVVKKGFHKGTGVAIIKDKLNANQLPTYAFGDGANDIDLLKAVDFPIAMANAIQELKEMAVFETHDHNQDGIRYGLEHFGLI
ncbi:cof-like hydrolase [Streptococcus urinalis FB127-CNA-2]|uniref:Cof-like hydrolase n=1 Tax=Streptococcus urinalis 2285-97 TaxID=764291 RepID=G5KDI1_9STRE|nr:Cof-type HAD-IIB family hydrolase [Streptococcus urinalis]EHJ55978.1 Cof-like hydrolase [Streptococcus urinalis 2285-97]EKS19370.1 cof-like hydrolase [Streptococcus urinalis FB127-CNA-2]VEF31500.1 Hydrolase (HAD superfamily) [Streptococcus urinalis]